MEYVKMMKSRHPYLTHARIRDARKEFCSYILCKVLQPGQLFEVFSKAREAMEKIEHVRDSIRQLKAQAERAKQEGDVVSLQVLIDRMHALEEEEEEISWGDFEDPRNPGVELPYDALDYDDRMLNNITSKPTSTPMEVGGACVVEPGNRGAPPDKHA